MSTRTFKSSLHVQVEATFGGEPFLAIEPRDPAGRAALGIVAELISRRNRTGLTRLIDDAVWQLHQDDKVSGVDADDELRQADAAVRDALEGVRSACAELAGRGEDV